MCGSPASAVVLILRRAVRPLRERSYEISIDLNRPLRSSLLRVLIGRSFQASPGPDRTITLRAAALERDGPGYARYPPPDSRRHDFQPLPGDPRLNILAGRRVVWRHRMVRPITSARRTRQINNQGIITLSPSPVYCRSRFGNNSGRANRLRIPLQSCDWTQVVLWRSGP